MQIKFPFTFIIYISKFWFFFLNSLINYLPLSDASFYLNLYRPITLTNQFKQKLIFLWVLTKKFIKISLPLLVSLLLNMPGLIACVLILGLISPCLCLKWNLETKNTFNVMKYGAHGDGKSDDSQVNAFQLCLFHFFLIFNIFQTSLF